ncbi:MAG: enoyl-CoA hydratase-related protein [Bacteroidota bacterium]
MIHLTKKYAGEISFLELSRPAKKNALNKEMIEQIIDYLEKSADSKQFRVLVISGKNRFLSAGADLEWMRSAKEQGEATNRADADLFTKLYQTLFNYPKPVIVSAEGGAYGGAIGLMACADIVTTTPEASFAFSETRLGLVPATVAPWVIRKTGQAFARKAFLTGNVFNGTEAMENGLAQYIFSPDKIQPKTREIAGLIAKNGPGALRETKLLLNRIDGQIVSIDEDLTHYCSTKIAEARTSKEGQEGVEAFFAKRKPSWNQ